LLVVLDDAGWGDVGLNWDSTRPDGSDTPTIDALASEGLALTNFYAGSSICTPSRACLLTGRYGKRTGVIGHFNSQSPGGLPASEWTFAKVRQQPTRPARWRAFRLLTPQEAILDSA
jgi:arylsulfatase A-like enzyme